MVSDTRLLPFVTHGDLLRGVLKTEIRWHDLPAKKGQFWINEKQRWMFVNAHVADKRGSSLQVTSSNP
jgi:hypothetical protein